MDIKLSILICSIPERSQQLAEVLTIFKNQTIGKPVEILSDCTGKELSIGSKRQKLLEKAQGKWIVYFDDDDLPFNYYVNEILKGCDMDVDCMGINGIMTTNGQNQQTWVHKLGYPIAENMFGFNYVRPIIHFNPVLKWKAILSGFKDMRYGEDMDYAKRLNPLLEKEYYIIKPLFHYRYSNKIPHNQKYGL